MRAIIIKQFGGLDSLVIENLPDPVPQPGSVLIEVKAFGINQAETHMRKGESAEAATVSDIECVGLVKSCPGGEFAVGTKVAAFMGGLGRTINGSYAEYTCPPATNFVAIKTDLPWEDFAVIPESYATAWTCLLRNLEIAKAKLYSSGAQHQLWVARPLILQPRSALTLSPPLAKRHDLRH